jgi:RNA polymerase sigma-70 factor (ECF subfamily)
MTTNFVKRDQLEQRIAQLLRQEDRAAIDLIYQNYADTLFGVINRIVGSKEVAEEVLQDTFVKIWKNALKYEAGKGRLFTWFANIARNTAIDRVRSASFRKSKQTTSTENLVSMDVLGSVETHIADPGLQKVLDSIDPKYRQLIELAYFQAYSQREIEKELNIPLGTIKTRLRKAIDLLREKLKDDHLTELSVIIVTLTKLLNY